MLKVLVVEDEPLIRRGIVLTVDWAALDCVVVGEAANGEEGFELAQRLQPGLIITDIKMPKLDGIQMLEKLREAGNPAQVIILTAYDSFDYARSALRLGVADFLVKPFHDGELEESVSTLRRRLLPERSQENPPELRVKTAGKSRYVVEAMDYIAAHFAQELSVGAIALALGISEGHLSHLFKKETDYTILNYLTRYRMHKAMELLREGRLKVYEVAQKVGYQDVTYFSTIFKKSTGLTPKEYQEANWQRSEPS